MRITKQRRRAFKAFLKQNRRPLFLHCKALARAVEVEGKEKAFLAIQLDYSPSGCAFSRDLLELMLRIGRDQATATELDLVKVANGLLAPNN